MSSNNTPAGKHQCIYSALPPDSIRLVTILPGSSSKGSSVAKQLPIECTMQVVFLKTKPQYNALSYTWNNPFQDHSASMGCNVSDDYGPNDVCTIIVNGVPLDVTRNLYDALRQFQPPKDAGGSVTQETTTTAQLSDIDELLPDPRVGYHTRPPRTRLMRAATNGFHKHVAALIRQGTNLEIQDRDGKLAIHYAAEYGHFEVVKMLTRAGCDLSAPDNSGKNALDYARESDRSQSIQVRKFLEDPKQRQVVPDPTSSHDVYSLPFWIDSICINQRDSSERTSQVMMMDRIYSAAQSTVVWLGPTDQYTALARHAVESMMQNGQFVEVPEADMSDREDLQALQLLLKRQWFRRMWVIQELAMAREIQIFCGSHTFDWAVLFSLARWMPNAMVVSRGAVVDWREQPDRYAYADGWHFSEFLGQTSALDCFCLIRLFTNETAWEHGAVDARIAQGARARYTQLMKAFGVRFSLPVLLWWTWDFQSTDPRDKIYALASLARPLGLQRDLPPNYDLTSQDVYVSAAFSFLQGTDDVLFPWTTFDGLSFKTEVPPGLVGGSFDLPSWAPDFRAPLHRYPLNGKFHKCCTSMEAKIKLLSNTNHLRVRGFCFDVIDQARSPNAADQALKQTGNEPWQSSLIRNFKTFLEFINYAEGVLPSGETALSTFRRTISATHFPPTGPVYTEKAEMETIHQWTLQSPEFLGMLRELAKERDLASLPSLKKILEAGQQTIFFHFHHRFLKGAERYAPGRQMFRTRRGFIGLAPCSVRAGDEVWLFAGAKMAFVLRREPEASDRFCFVGDAYVDGIMQGQAAEGKGEADFQDVELV